jgi:sodium/proline symporter
MSTSSAQLLSLSSAFSVDVYAKFIRKNASHKELLKVSRLMVFAVTVLAIVLSYDPNTTILSLVGYAWAGLGSSFGSVVVFSLFWSRMNKTGAFFGIVIGSVTVLVWPLFEHLGGWFKVYAMVPGFTLSSIAIVIFSLLTAKPEESIKVEYEKYKQELN